MDNAVILHPDLLHKLHIQLSVAKLASKDTSSVPLESAFKALVSHTSEHSVFFVKGKIVHIRRVSRHTTFVDITLQHSFQQLSNLGKCETSKCTSSESNETIGVEKRRLDELLICPHCVRIELLVPREVLASLPQKLRIGSLVKCRGERLENLAEGRRVADGPILNHLRTPREHETRKDTLEEKAFDSLEEEALDSLESGYSSRFPLASSSSQDSTQVAHETPIPISKALTPVQSEPTIANEVRTPTFCLKDQQNRQTKTCPGTTGSLLDVDWMLEVSSLTVSDPRGSTSGNIVLDKSLAVKGELPTHCFGRKRNSVKDGVCKFWVNEGRCVRGPDCAYKHPPHGEELKRARAAYLEAKARAHQHSGNEGKAKRAQVFGDWICKTYGKEFGALRVMDVAAGAHGELAFHLAETGVFCTSVEPRERKLTKAQRKALAQKGVILPKDSSTPALPASVVGVQRREMFEVSEYWTRIATEEATVLVGLHPDEVTEAIVDVALQANVPFAVVPCCVFPKMFPDRRIGDRPVISYEDFLEYLQNKGTAYGKTVEKETLKFAGSNVVLFTRT